VSQRSLRSALYLPAHRAAAVAKARTIGCDAVILDLEDAVAPDAKEEARNAALTALREGGFGERLVVVRINAPGSEWGAADMAALHGSGAGAIAVPKLSNPAQAAQCRAAVGDDVALWGMWETCGAFASLAPLAEAMAAARFSAAVIGTNDLASEMRCTLDAGRAAILPLLTQAIVAGRAHGMAVLDGVFNDIADEAGLAAECAQGAALGFDGKTVIHPRQVAAANAAFAPSADRLAWARAVVDAFALPENAAKGVIAVNGRMTELLHLEEARRLLAMEAAIARNGGFPGPE